MWGFARAILDVLNKHFQETLSISITQSTMIQATTYLGYFMMALPAGIILTRWGYRRGIVLGLLLFGTGSLIFIAGEQIMSFGIFLAALFIIGCGLVTLETAANPYAAELGTPATAASRLNLAQSFNGLGCILAPVIVGNFLFSNANADISFPYTIMGISVLVLAAIFSKIKLPEINDTTERHPKSSSNDTQSITNTIKHLWGIKRFRIGITALLCYEIAEISINSLFINYATSDGWMEKSTASIVLSFGALSLFILLVCSMVTIIGALVVSLNIGILSKCGLFACYAFEAIMFPTIFAITISGIGDYIKIASSLLMMTPIGGAIGTFLMGWVADNTSISTAFIIPTFGYAFVFVYAFYILKQSHK